MSEWCEHGIAFRCKDCRIEELEADKEWLKKEAKRASDAAIKAENSANKLQSRIESALKLAEKWKRGFGRNVLLHRNPADCAYELREALENDKDAHMCMTEE